MAKVNRTEVTKRIVEGLRINAAVEAVPDTCANQIVPVFVCNEEEIVKVEYNQKSTTGSVTIHTTDSVMDTYLTGIHIFISKDAANDGTSLILTLFPSHRPSTAINMIRIPFNATTAEHIEYNITFPQPIKLAKGKAISLTHTFAAGTADFGASIMYIEKQKP